MNSSTRTIARAAAPFWFAVRLSVLTLDADSPAPGGQELAASAEPVEKPLQILVNHVGFTPLGAKYCLVAGSTPVAFEVIDTATGQAALVARTTPGGPDLGVWQVGDQDDRPIHTEPCNATAQFCFIIAQAATVRLTQEVDPAYAANCREAGLRCLAWCQKNNIGRTSTDLGAAVTACVELHRTLGEDQYRTLAAEYARRLLALQVTEPTGGAGAIRGFFRTSPTDAEPRRDISHGCWHLIGLCEALEHFPNDADAAAWRRGIRLYADDYLAPLLARSAFGIAPFGLYTKDPGGSRRAGDYWYRYFMEPGSRWWVGINANLASAGVGLAKAARLLKEPRLAAFAQRQLDWILGVNPFHASTITGVGRNQPRQFVTGEFKPMTPLIDGAVMNGIGGTGDDEPDLKPGSWQTCEYWTPMVCYTMWLMSELSARPGE